MSLLHAKSSRQDGPQIQDGPRTNVDGSIRDGDQERDGLLEVETISLSRHTGEEECTQDGRSQEGIPRGAHFERRPNKGNSDCDIGKTASMAPLI